MDDIYQLFDFITDPREKVLATIVQVKGSAYKREGSSMLFFEDGSQVGMLTAGCLETDLAIRSMEVIEKQEPTLLQFDLFEEDDLGWGQGVGCNGTIDVLLEPVTKNFQTSLLLTKGLLERNQPVINLKNLNKLGEFLFISDKTEPFGKWSEAIPVVKSSEKSGKIPGQNIYQHTYHPKPRLIVFGAGPDAIPLVSMAVETGFTVIVCDWRENFCQKKYFPKAERILQGFPADIFKQLTFTPYDFIVIMSHNFHKDQEILASLLYQNVSYLGVLGPKERTKRLFNGNTVPSWISSPIGAPIGAKGPVEIAVSIMAEMIEKWRNRIRQSVEIHG